jgi:dTDP-4-amino-4,6-dideoxygalactose transaminase
MSLEPIPFNKASVVGDEQRYVAEAIASGHLAGDGPFTRRCHALLEQLLRVPRVLLTTSCTHALEMAALLLDLRPGDEVIMPSFTFVSTANAFVLRGARPVFADIRPDTLNLDERALEALVNRRTRAIVPVHYAGVGCEMDALCDLAARHGLALIEDNAHGLFGCYRDRMLGTFGALATLSFHETKNISCGEGGALLVNDPHLVSRAEFIREKGTNRSDFLRGRIDKYVWVEIGSSYLPSDVLAAYLYGQLERREQIYALRRCIFERYAAGLAGWAAEQGVRLPLVPAHCEQAYHMFYLLLPSAAHRQRLIDGLREQGIGSAFHYPPLHLSPVGERFGYRQGHCPLTEDLSARLLRLPFYNNLSVAQQERVLDVVRAFRC